MPVLEDLFFNTYRKVLRNFLGICCDALESEIFRCFSESHVLCSWTCVSGHSCTTFPFVLIGLAKSGFLFFVTTKFLIVSLFTLRSIPVLMIHCHLARNFVGWTSQSELSLSLGPTVFSAWSSFPFSVTPRMLFGLLPLSVKCFFFCLLAPTPPIFPYCSASLYLIGSYILITLWACEKGSMSSIKCVLKCVCACIKCELINWQFISFMKRLLDLTPSDFNWNIPLHGLYSSKRSVFHVLIFFWINYLKIIIRKYLHIKLSLGISFLLELFCMRLNGLFLLCPELRVDLWIFMFWS